MCIAYSAGRGVFNARVFTIFPFSTIETYHTNFSPIVHSFSISQRRVNTHSFARYVEFSKLRRLPFSPGRYTHEYAHLKATFRCPYLDICIYTNVHARTRYTEFLQTRISTRVWCGPRNNFPDRFSLFFSFTFIFYLHFSNTKFWFLILPSNSNSLWNSRNCFSQWNHQRFTRFKFFRSVNLFQRINSSIAPCPIVVNLSPGANEIN